MPRSLAVRGELAAWDTPERFVRNGALVGLYHKIEELLPDVPCPVVQFVGPEGGEGTSALAWEFSYLNAIAGARRVLLLNGAASEELRRFSHPEPPASSPSWSGEEIGDRWEPPMFLPVEETGLCLGALPTLVDTRDSHFFVAQVQATLVDLRPEFDLIAIDSHPVVKDWASVLIASRVDGVVLVLREERTTAQAAEAAKQALEGVGAHVLGVVLTRPDDS